MPTKADEDPLPKCADDNLAQACVRENICMTKNTFGGKKPREDSKTMSRTRSVPLQDQDRHADKDGKFGLIVRTDQMMCCRSRCSRRRVNKQLPTYA
jgi:hypothetical protein